MRSLSRKFSMSARGRRLCRCASTNVTQQTPMSQPGARAAQSDLGVQLHRQSCRHASRFLDQRSGQCAEHPTDARRKSQEGRQLGALIATDLVADINAMGLSAVQAGPGSSPQVGDGVIRGYLVSVQGGGAGSTVQRFVIGFGAGTSEMDTVVEGYAVTPQGWRKLGSGTLSSSGNKTPGMVVPAAVAIATGQPDRPDRCRRGESLWRSERQEHGLEGRAKATADAIAEQLKIRFQDRGWIQ